MKLTESREGVNTRRLGCCSAMQKSFRMGSKEPSPRGRAGDSSQSSGQEMTPSGRGTTKDALRWLRQKQALENNWLRPEQATPEQLRAARRIQAHVRGKQARRASGLVGRLAEKAALAQQRAELQLIKHRGLGCLCNLTTRWGCSWSSRHRRPLLFIAGLLIVLAFTVQARESAWGVCGLRLR